MASQIPPVVEEPSRYRCFAQPDTVLQIPAELYLKAFISLAQIPVCSYLCSFSNVQKSNKNKWC